MRFVSLNSVSLNRTIIGELVIFLYNIMPTLRREGLEVSNAPNAAVSVPDHVLCPAAKDVLPVSKRSNLTLFMYVHLCNDVGLASPHIHN